MPSGWTAVPLDQAAGVRLTWPADETRNQKLPAGTDCRLRLAVALDYRDAQLVEARLAESGTLLGCFDIRFAYVFQLFELPLTSEQAEAALREGVVLRRCGGELPLWIFDELGGEAKLRLFALHLVAGADADADADADTDPMERFLDSFVSLSSLQPFGWLEGCVLDGLYALRPVLGAAKIDPALDAHLAEYIAADGRLHYEDLHGRAADDSFTTIEATLPLAVIAKYRPDHPVVERALAYWTAKSDGGAGAITDGQTVTAEGMYTVAYPLAVIASREKRGDLAEQAVRQMLLRRDTLAVGPHVYLRYAQRTGERTFRSWARAFAWYMLGMTRTWIELKQSDHAGLPEMAAIEEELLRIADVALGWRQSSGLWSCFLDEPQTEIDTSGSSGIAAALALGAGHGLLAQRHLDAAAESLASLRPYLTPDGILSGVAQHNAGGVELQRGGYRVLSQMGMGLMAQLYAGLLTRP